MWWEHFVVAEGQGLQGRRIWDLSLGVKRGKSVDEITSVVMISMLLESGTAKCSPVSGGASSMERRRQTTRRLPLKFLEGVKRRVEQNLQNETKALHETSLDLLSVQRAFIHSKIWKSKKKTQSILLWSTTFFLEQQQQLHSTTFVCKKLTNLHPSNWNKIKQTKKTMRKERKKRQKFWRSDQIGSWVKNKRK